MSKDTHICNCPDCKDARTHTVRRLRNAVINAAKAWRICATEACSETDDAKQRYGDAILALATAIDALEAAEKGGE